MSIEDQINHLVNGFVADITKLARQAAVATLTGALAGSVVVAPRAGVVATRAKPAGISGSSRRRRKGEKRPQSDIASVQKTVVAHVQRHPGQRVEEINRALGTKTADVRLPLAKAIEAGEIKTKGNRRATRYFPG